MKTKFVLVFSALAMLSMTSCKKCFNCTKQIIIEVDNRPVETDSYYSQDICGKDEREKVEADGYTCIATN